MPCGLEIKHHISTDSNIFKTKRRQFSRRYFFLWETIITANNQVQGIMNPQLINASFFFVPGHGPTKSYGTSAFDGQDADLPSVKFQLGNVEMTREIQA